MTQTNIVSQKTRLLCKGTASYCIQNKKKKTSQKSNEPIKFCVTSKIKLFNNKPLI
jgi:hypothetical protein